MPTSIIIAAAEAIGFLVETYAINATFAAAVNFAASYVVTRVFGSKPPDISAPVGTRQQVPPNTTNSVPVVYGQASLGGTFVDAVLSTDQQTMYYVLSISCVSDLGNFQFYTGSFYWGDRLINFSLTNPPQVVSLTDGAGNSDTSINTKLYIYLYKSNKAGVITSLNGGPPPSTVMGGSDIVASLRWPASGRQMNGLAFAIVKLVYSTAANTTSLQPITFCCGQTFPVVGDPSAQVALPGSVLLDYLTDPVYGCAIPLANVDQSSLTALNTYSNELIPYTNYYTFYQRRYTINGVVDTSGSCITNIDDILTCCDSWLAYQSTSGQWAAVVNKAEFAPSVIFTDADIIGEVRVSVSDLSASINQIEAAFPNSTNKDQAAYVNMAVPSGLLYPNEPINKLSTSFKFSNNSVAAQYLANRILKQAREDLIVTITTAYPGIQYDAGTVVGVVLPVYGWDAPSGKLFRITKITETSLPDGNLGATIELSEYNSNVYDTGSISAYQPSPNSGIPFIDNNAAGASIVYASSDAGPVIVTNYFHSPDGFVWNTQIISLTFVAPFTGYANMSFEGSANFTNSSSTSVSSARWSIQDPTGTWSTDTLTASIPSGATSAYFPMNTTRTFYVTQGSSYTFAVYAAKLNSADTFTVSNLLLRATIVKQ